MYLCRNNQVSEYRTPNKTILAFSKGSFIEQEIKLLPNDVIYLFTDGYPDQKNGETGAKLYYEPFKNLLSVGTNEKLETKHQFLKDYMKNWKKRESQTDDMLIFGLRI